MIRVSPQVPRRKTSARKFGLGVAGRTEDREPVDLTPLDSLQLLRDEAMVAVCLKTGKGVLNEGDQPGPRLFSFILASIVAGMSDGQPTKLGPGRESVK